MSAEKSVSKEVVMGTGLALTMGLMAMSGCTPFGRHEANRAAPASKPAPIPSVSTSPTPTCVSALERFRLSLNLQVGGAYAVNGEDCVNVYAEEVADTSGSIGTIPADARFYIRCYDLTAESLRITFGRTKGRVALTELAVQQLDEDPSAHNIRTC